MKKINVDFTWVKLRPVCLVIATILFLLSLEEGRELYNLLTYK